MTFAAPLFLAAVLAGVIPLVLHMIHNKKAAEVSFSTLRFLRVSVQRTRRRKYIDDVTLLILRAAALVLIAVGLSRPAITGLLALRGQGTETAVALVLDNSASMAVVDNGQVRLETARKAGEQILDALNEGDKVALLLTGGVPAPGQGRLFATHETIRQALMEVQPSYERADLAGKLRQARSLLAEENVLNREIYVLTDNQALSWQALKGDEEETEQPGNDIPVVVVNLNRDPAPNVALRRLQVDSPALTAGVPMRVKVELLNTASVGRQHHLELHLDGNKHSVSPTLTLPPGGSLRHEFPFVVEGSGVHRGEVRLSEEDGSAAENRLYFGLAVDQQIPVAVIKSRRQDISYVEDTYYLERALAPVGLENWAIRPTILTAEQLLGEPLSRYAVVFCVNLPALESASADKLREYAWGGGHLVWICGQNVQPDAYNQMNDGVKGQLLPAKMGDLRQPAGKGDSWHVAYLDKDYPALMTLTEPATLYQSILVHKHFLLVPGEEVKPRVLAKLDDGQPLLVERTTGSGSVLMLGTGVHVEWTNLPLRPIFMPLVARLTFFLAGVQADRTQVAAGAPLVVPLGGQTGPVNVEVTRPGGETVRQRTEDKAEVFRYPDTHDIGVYVVRVGDPQGQKQYIFAVNPDPDEADAASLTGEELKARFGKRPVVLCDTPEDVSGVIRRLREGRSLWTWFLWCVLIGLVFEAFVANRFGGRAVRDDQTKSAAGQLLPVANSVGEPRP